MRRRALLVLPVLLAGLFTGPTPELAARQPVRSRHGMVVAQEPIAAGVGREILEKGGNAVDAAVAVGFALAVTHPFAGNIGGGGFMLIRMADGTSTFIDFRERAPGAASRDMYLDARGEATRKSIEGWTSSGVPGTVRGLEYAHQRYGGNLSWAELIGPAVALASDGFPVSYQFSQEIREDERMQDSPESFRIFLNSGEYYEQGDVLRQPELASTLAQIAAGGADAFYEGPVAERFAAEMASHGGLITTEDLAAYQPTEREPLTGSYKGYGILTAPPPSSGGLGILEMLGMLEGTDYEATGAGSADTIHYVAEVMRRYFADRAQYLGDPDFNDLPISKLLDPQYLAARRATIDPDHATPSGDVPPGLTIEGDGETTHYNVVDQDGNAVAVTYTLNGGFGNGITVPGLGFLLNNEMDDFSAKPGTPNMFGLVQGEANSIEPGKRPLSSMTPTILTRDGEFAMAVGAPGGSRIITAVLLTILNVVDFDMNIQDAVDAPRYHHQWQPDLLYLEGTLSPDTVHLLEAMGHQVDYSPGVVLARVAAIRSRDGWLEGAVDERADGAAAGY